MIGPGKYGVLRLVKQNRFRSTLRLVESEALCQQQKIGQGRVEKNILNRLTLDETLDIGFDTGTPVTESYELPFAFTGKLDEVAIDLN